MGSESVDVDALLFAAGAKKIRAGAGQPPGATDSLGSASETDCHVVRGYRSSRKRCGDVNILINNAGIMLKTTMPSERPAESLRREMDANVFGTLAMIQAFVSILCKKRRRRDCKYVSARRKLVHIPIQRNLLQL